MNRHFFSLSYACTLLDDALEGASTTPTSSACEEAYEDSNSKAVFETALELESSYAEQVDAVESCKRRGGQKCIACSSMLSESMPNSTRIFAFPPSISFVREHGLFRFFSSDKLEICC